MNQNYINNQQVNPVHQTGQLQSVSNEMKFRADSETIEILNETYPELINSAINIAIKRFSKTVEYKSYYKIKDLRNMNDGVDDIVDDIVEDAVQQTQSISQPAQQPASQQSAPSPIVDFSTW